MPFIEGQSGNPDGRPKGSKNKVCQSIKQAFKDAFEEMGGVESLVLWGEKNPTEFYKICARFIPIDITSGGEKIVQYVSTIDTQGRVITTPTLRETTSGDIQPVEIQPN
jgi:hypothetical protein